MNVSSNEPVEGGAAATDLWQCTLHNIGDRMNVQVPHPLDRAYAIGQLRDLYAVGERPSYDEFKSYLEELWPQGPGARRMLRQIWRMILRNPHHQFRDAWSSRFVTLDMLARENGLRPIEDRLEDVAARALADFHETAVRNPDFEMYLQAHRTLQAAIKAVTRFRATRLGPHSLGVWWEAVHADNVSLEDVFEWRRLRRKYGGPE